MPKVLMVGWGYPPEIEGGLDIHVARIFEQLHTEIEVELALPAENAPDRDGIIPVETEGDDMLSMASDMSRKLVKLSGDYDIVHTHDWFGAESGLKSRKYSDTRWVSTFHSLASGRSRNPSHRIENLERAMVERSDACLAVSEKLAEEVEEKYRKRPKVIHNGFSRADATGRDLKEELGAEKIVLYVGRHAEQKGVEHLIYGFSKLESDATLVIGGEGHMTEALKEFVHILDIEEDVIFTGFIPGEELGDYYSSADVFVSPSINEPFGLTVTEALEAGTPVVATSSGAEEVLPEDAIIQVEPDSESIKQGIERALDRGVLPEFESRSWEEVADEIREIYSRF
ncbi:MAG: glycosyltransferase family 4 protein [Candidatus Nanohaloarchaea archaeon]